MIDIVRGELIEPVVPKGMDEINLLRGYLSNITHWSEVDAIGSVLINT